MPSHFADRLIEAIESKGAAVCVGVDPLFERLPQSIIREAGGRDIGDCEKIADAVRRYGVRLLRVVAPLVPAVKINIAFFETYYWAGVRAYYDLVAEAHRLGLIVIGDVKRGDIGHTAGRYAAAHLGDPTAMGIDSAMIPDAITINPYLGADGVIPFVEVAAQHGRGLFVLVQTSNESSCQVQGLKLPEGTKVVEHIAKLVDGWATAEGRVGSRGYSLVGAVVAPHDHSPVERLRTLMPRTIFLVPGFGAQGRGGEDVRSCFTSEGGGAIVAASRSVILAYENERYATEHGDDWEACVEHACRDFVKEVAGVVAR